MPETGYDTSPVSIPLVLGVVGGLLLLVIVAAILLYRVDVRPVDAPTAAELSASSSTSLRGAPELQAAPARDWQLLKRSRERLLGSYGWVDESRGVARIPITQAMQLYAEEGWQSLAEREALAPARAQQRGWEALGRAARESFGVASSHAAGEAAGNGPGDAADDGLGDPAGEMPAAADPE